MAKGIPGRTPCSEQDCDQPSVGHGLCNKHYLRWRTHGDVFRDLPTISERSSAQWAAWRAERGMEQPGYSWLHKQVYKQRGRATNHRCVTCGQQAVHWAQIHDTDGTDPFEHYRPMCQNCHWAYDDIGKRSAETSGHDGKSAAAVKAWETRRGQADDDEKPG